MKKEMSKARKMVDKICGIILVIYFIVYFILSFNGHYSPQPVVSGKMRLASGFGIRDIHVWEPKYTILLPYGFNALGAIYGELIWLDRKVWHRDKPVYTN
jgi:hypothetical protein